MIFYLITERFALQPFFFFLRKFLRVLFESPVRKRSYGTVLSDRKTKTTAITIGSGGALLAVSSVSRVLSGTVINLRAPSPETLRNFFRATPKYLPNKHFLGCCFE